MRTTREKVMKSQFKRRRKQKTITCLMKGRNISIYIYMDKLTIMDTDYARLSLKTQSLLRSAIANRYTISYFEKQGYV